MSYFKGRQAKYFCFHYEQAGKWSGRDMGVLDFTYDNAANTFTSIDDKRKTIWTFKVKNEAMEGTLIIIIFYTVIN